MRPHVLLVFLLLAGCLGSPDQSIDPREQRPGSRVAPPGAPTGFSSDLGSIEGTVVSVEASPIASASVSIYEPFELAATTDDAGRFAFEQLTPGPYTLVATAPGFESQVRKVTVEAEAVTDAQFILEPLAILEPTSATFIDEGFLTLQLTAPGTPPTNPGGLLTLVAGASRDKWVFHHASEPTLVGYVGGLVWTANQYFSARNMTLHANSTHGKADHFLQTSRGPSPVVLTIVLPNATSAKNTVTSQFYLVNECGTQPTGCTSKPPERWQQVVFQQRFHVYSTLFYVEPPPVGYSPVPDS